MSDFCPCDLTNYKCPVCGYVNEPSKNDGMNSVVSINMTPYVGIFCLRCYAKWIASNIPRMVPPAEVAP